MYETYIEFSDGTPPFHKKYANRREYNAAMKTWQEQYKLTIEKISASTDGNGVRYIFYKAEKRPFMRQLKRVEVSKSRERYNSRRNGGAR